MLLQMRMLSKLFSQENGVSILLGNQYSWNELSQSEANLICPRNFRPSSTVHVFWKISLLTINKGHQRRHNIRGKKTQNL